MKTEITFLIMVILLPSTTVLATKRPPKVGGPIALSIILDSAWSNEHEIDDYRSLSRQVIATLKPGDYLEILIATSSKTHMRVAQFIKSGNAQELKNITTLINKISCPILSDVDVSKSVDFALKRLIKSDTKNSFTDAFVIVFSDGRLNDGDVKKLQQFSKEFKKRSWSLYITGTYHTNKRLLVAAHQGDFGFSLIRDANPTLWIKRGDAATKPTLPHAPTPGVSQPGKSKSNPTTTIDVSVSLSQGEEQLEEAPPETVLEDTKPEQASTPTDQEDEQPESPVPAGAGDEPAQEDTVPSDAPKKPAKKTNIFAWLLPLIAMLALFAAILARGISKTRQWRSRVSSHLKSTKETTPGTLIAEVKSQTYHLGRIDKIRQIHIGSNPQNSIRIYDKAVAARHFRIFRRFGSLWVKNLSSKTAFINGVPLKPAKKTRIKPPCSININDSITIKLQLQKPLTQNLSKQESDHGSKE